VGNPPPPPGTMTVREAADEIGYPTRCILTRFIRTGLLPWPDGQHRFKVEDVQALKRWMHDRSLPRPDHRRTAD